MINPLVNFLMFQIGWLACVLGAARGFPQIGPVVVAALLGLHLLLTLNAAREARLIIAAGVLGSGIDTILMSNGVYTFTGHSIGWRCPLWITALWMIFSTTFNHSLSWLLGRPILASALGVIGGPLSYYAGARLGAATLSPNPTVSMAVLAIVWGMAMPGLLWMAAILSRVPKQARAPAVMLLLLSLFSVIATSQAAEIEGVSFVDRQQVQGTTLVLNGVGLLRYRIFFRAYVAALYLGEGGQPAKVLSDVPKRLEIQYFWSIAGPDFGKAAEKFLAENVPAATLAQLRPRINQLHQWYEDVKPGDRYALTYIPGIGTELALNGEPKGIIEGADFAAAYFAIWLGPKPLSTSLKSHLLGIS